MSKIYKALEKAERERELKKEAAPPREFKEVETPEVHEIKSELSANVSMGSEHSGQQLVSLHQRGSMAAEGFRKLRTYLMRTNNLQPPKVIMITSATRGEGKTFVATNLAIGIANHFHIHALLVDCDLRDPQVANRFGLQNGRGLSDYLVGEGKISDFLMRTQIDKLNIFPGGRMIDNPTELIGSKKMEALIHELKTRYSDRYIILDATPLLGTTEPDVLAKWVDGIIIVVEAGKTERETVKQAILSIEKQKILGFVLNSIQFKSPGLSSRYFGSSRYYYRYGYGKERTTPPPSHLGRLFQLMKRSK
jgi:protein-tyrosine kinase